MERHRQMGQNRAKQALNLTFPVAAARWGEQRAKIVEICGTALPEEGTPF